jgi:hypothetical protein
MNHAAEFRRCLIELDVIGICDLWFHVCPNLPQPRNNEEALISLHHARTQAESIPEKLRCYSHSWLLERGLPSGLPDQLKPKADRLYPRKVEAVGVAVMATSADGIMRARAIERAMSDAVAECYADGERDPEVIKERMAEARRAMEAS